MADFIEIYKLFCSGIDESNSTSESYRDIIKKKNIDINAKDAMGQTAPFAAITFRRFDLFKLLIEDLKADRKVVDVKGMNLYFWAKEHEDTLVPETLKFAKFIKKLDAAEEVAAIAAAKKKKTQQNNNNRFRR